jgi:hypothetical protein
MTAISKTYTAPSDAQVDADSPIDTTLLTQFRDDIIFLKEWLGHSYVGGAVQDHNHDGTNSAAIETGVLVKNGSFEDGTTSGWTQTLFSGGSAAVGTTNNMDGARALAITSTSTANGGAQLDSSGFVALTGALRDLLVTLAVKASVANVSSKAEVIWFDNAQAQISVSTVYTSTNTPTTGTLQAAQLTPPSTARYFKVRITGGVPGSGSSAGTIYFDGVAADFAKDPNFASVTTASSTSLTISGIPSAARRITFLFPGFSGPNVSTYSLQAGNASGVQATGYNLLSAGATKITVIVAGLSEQISGKAVFERVSASIWAIDSKAAGNAGAVGADYGAVTMSGAGDITQMTLTATQPFAGTISVRWEI